MDHDEEQAPDNARELITCSNINNAVGIADAETMRSAVGIHKLKQRNLSGFDVATALEWATIGNATMLGMDDAVGSI